MIYVSNAYMNGIEEIAMSLIVKREISTNADGVGSDAKIEAEFTVDVEDSYVEDGVAVTTFFVSKVVIGLCELDVDMFSGRFLEGIAEGALAEARDESIAVRAEKAIESWDDWCNKRYAA